jgi:hypothetical protein
MPKLFEWLPCDTTGLNPVGGVIVPPKVWVPYATSRLPALHALVVTVPPPLVSSVPNTRCTFASACAVYVRT